METACFQNMLFVALWIYPALGVRPNRELFVKCCLAKDWR